MMKRFEGIWNATPDKRYKNFVSTVADREIVWVFMGDVMSVWPGKEYATKLYSLEEITCIDTHDFCDLVLDKSANGHKAVRVFPTEKNCLEVTQEKLLRDICEELDRIE